MSEVTKKVEILIPCILKLYTIGYTNVQHVLMGRAHRESSMSKLDNDAKRVANIYTWNYPGFKCTWEGLGECSLLQLQICIMTKCLVHRWSLKTKPINSIIQNNKDFPVSVS